MPEDDVLPAAARHEILTILIRPQGPAGEFTVHGMATFGAHAAGVHPAGIGIVRAGVDDGHFARLPVGDVDEDAPAGLLIHGLLGLAEVEDTEDVGGAGGGAGDRHVATHPARDFMRQGLG